MSTMPDINPASLTSAPSGWLDNGVSTGVIVFSIGLAAGIIIGGILGLWLFFRFYLLDGMNAIETYSGKEWGE